MSLIYFRYFEIHTIKHNFRIIINQGIPHFFASLSCFTNTHNPALSNLEKHKEAQKYLVNSKWRTLRATPEVTSYED